MSAIIDKYHARSRAIASFVCVGLDNDITRLPERFATSETPQYDFNRWVIDQTAPYAAAFKLNSAFYEARGAQGWQEMTQTVAYLRDQYPDIVTICDAKRADIDNTNEGYVAAIFDHIGFDAITLHPYLGGETLLPFLERTDKASIILCRTSNRYSGELQDLDVGGMPLWAHIAKQVSNHWNVNDNCMLVVGATYPDDLKRVREIAPTMPFLVPGVGAQGGDAAAVMQNGLTANGDGLIINSSRGIIFAESPKEAAETLRNTLNAARP